MNCQLGVSGVDKSISRKPRTRLHVWVISFYSSLLNLHRQPGLAVAFFFFSPLLSFNNQRKKIKTYSPLTYAKMNIFKQIVFHGGATHLDAVTCCTTHMRFYLYVCTKMDMTFSALQSRGTTNKAKRYKKLSYKFCYHNMWSPCG